MRVSIYDLETAIEWLDANEGTDGEHESCQRVADFLRKEIQRRINNSAVRKVSREWGIPERAIRKLKR